MKYKTVNNEPLEFNKDTACNGDMYLFREGKLIYLGNAIPEPPKLSLSKRVRNWFFK